MKTVLRLIDGKKTYIGIVALFILGGLKAVEVIDQSLYDTLLLALLGWTGYGLRDAIKKIQ